MKDPINVLVVDDEADLRKYIIHVLNTMVEQEVSITEAENGAQAIEKCENQKFDLIFLDVKMPELSGLEVLSQIKGIEQNAHIIMVTAHGNVRDAVEAIKEGAYDYIEKPIESEQVLDILNQAISALRSWYLCSKFSGQESANLRSCLSPF